MVSTRRQAQLLFQTLTVPSADADATSTDAENIPWLAERPSLLLGLGGVTPSAVPVLAVPTPSKGSGLCRLRGRTCVLLPVVGPALLRPRASKCTTSSLCPRRVLRHTKSRSRSHTLQDETQHQHGTAQHDMSHMLACCSQLSGVGILVKLLQLCKHVQCNPTVAEPLSVVLLALGTRSVM